MKALILTLLAVLLSTGARAQVLAKPPQEENLISCAERALDCLTRGDFTGASRDFNSTMLGALGPEKIADVWKSLTGQMGAFKKRLGSRKARIQNYDIIYITCQFEKGPIDVQWAFDKDGKIGGLHFLPGAPPQTESKPPAYDNPSKYTELEVVVGSGEWALHGTLTLPRGKGPFPAVVLIHGSGPLDRDETVGGTKVFRDISHGLAAAGVASLRYDKRTFEHRDQLLAVKDRITVREETMDDAQSAIELLCERHEIKRSRIVALGHSLGGMLIPRIAHEDRTCSGFVIMAGTARPLEDVIVEQYTYIFGLDSVLSEEEQRELASLKRKVARVKDPSLNASTPADSLPLGLPASYWRDLRSYDPVAAAHKLDRPVLILQGGRDYQVTGVDFGLWKKALSGHSKAAFKFYPSLNHAFVEGKGMAAPEEYMKPGNVAEEMIRDLAAWIKRM